MNTQAVLESMIKTADQYTSYMNINDFTNTRGSPCGIIAKVQNCSLDVSEFKLPLCYCIHFHTNTLGKGMNPLISPSYGLDSTTTVILQEWLWHGIIHKGWYAMKQKNKPNQTYTNSKWNRKLFTIWKKLSKIYIQINPLSYCLYWPTPFRVSQSLQMVRGTWVQF